MAQWAMINDRCIVEENASLHIRDLSVQRGYGIFDFLKVIRSQPVFQDDHLDRFYFSAEAMHLPVRWSKEILKDHIETLIKKNQLIEGGIRLTLTGGYSPDGYSLSQPNLVISCSSFQVPGKDQFEKGIALMSYGHQRQLPSVKTIDYVMAIWLQPLIRQNGSDDVLYHNNGHFTECPRSNFFIVTKDERILTPASGILKGITRNNLLKVARKNYQVEERELTLADIQQAQEAFITSTTKIILPVSRIDDKNFSAPGIITKKLHHSFLELHQIKSKIM